MGKKLLMTESSQYSRPTDSESQSSSDASSTASTMEAQDQEQPTLAALLPANPNELHEELQNFYNQNFGELTFHYQPNSDHTFAQPSTERTFAQPQPPLNKDHTFFERPSRSVTFNESANKTFAPSVVHESDYETPKSSKKRKKIPTNGESSGSGFSLVDDLIKNFIDPEMQNGAKVGILSSINSILEKSNLASPQDLMRQDFCTELGKVLQELVASPSKNLPIALTLVSKMINHSNESKAMVHQYCGESLRKFSEHCNIMTKANQVLSEMGLWNGWNTHSLIIDDLKL